MEVKFDKEKTDKIIEKMEKISEVNAEYAKVISKYTLSDKEIEYLNALSASFAKKEKALGKLSSSVENIMKELDTYTKESKKDMDDDTNEQKPISIPIATPSIQNIGVESASMPQNTVPPVFIYDDTVK